MNKKPLVRGVILEGLSNAGKTSTLKALKQVQANDPNAERSILVLGEHYSQQLQKIQGESVSLDCAKHARLLDERVTCIEQLNDWAIYLGPEKRTSRGLFYVLERFHLNHRFAYGESSQISDIEQRVADLGGICFLLTVSPENIRERILYRERKNMLQENIDQTCDDWLEEQARLIALSRKSIVPTVILETDGRDWMAYANKIMTVMDEA